MLNHGTYDFDILLDGYIPGAAKDIETDDEYKFNWKSFGYYCLEKYPEFIRKEVLQDYKNGKPDVVDSLFGIALDHAHYIEFGVFESDRISDPKYGLYANLQRGVARRDLPPIFILKSSERYDQSVLMDLAIQHSVTDISIDDNFLNKILDGMLSKTEKKFIDSQRNFKGD